MPTQVFITGASGLIGRRLVLDRLQRGDRLVLLSRDPARTTRLFAAESNPNIEVVQGDAARPGPWQQAVAGCDAVVHLAGAGIADKRWSSAYKKKLFDSRIEGTRQIVQAIDAIPAPRRPRVLVNASAIGFYGHAGERELTEDSLPGADFLSKLCVAWEAQARAAETLGLRVVMLRTAVVLDDRGGPLKLMALPFKLFVGGPIGWGRQWFSWIHWRDVVGLIDLALEEEAVRGPLNLAAPEPVRQREFAAEFGAALGRPSWLPAPKFALRLMLGQVAHAIAASQRVVPEKARRFGYVFLYPTLERALDSLLVKRDDEGSDSLQTDLGADAHVDSMPERPIRLLAMAVDGTLLRSDGSIAQATIHACRAAQRHGCVVVLATARPPRGLRSILQTLDITSPTINYNGALIWNHLDDRAQYHEALPGELAREIVLQSRAMYPEILIGLEVLDRWYTDRIDPRYMPLAPPHLNTESSGGGMGSAGGATWGGRLTEPDYVGPLDQFFNAPVTKINLLGQPETLQSVKEMIRQRWWSAKQVAVFAPDAMVVQITAPLVDKGIALQRIARKMGIGREAVMAIGDALNDAGMIEWAGFGVAMGNASTAVKKLAKAITASNDDQGAAKAIQRYVLARQ